jgi:hypothetical protein
MAEREIENAVIERARLGIEDHGILTFLVSLKYQGGGQGFGGYSLEGRGGGNFCPAVIREILTTVGVEEWTDLVGKPVRADHDWSKVYRLGNFLEDRWCDPAELVKTCMMKAALREVRP